VRRAFRAEFGLVSLMLVATAAPSVAQHLGAGSTSTAGTAQDCAACHGTHERNQGVAGLRVGDGDLRVARSAAPGLGDPSLSCLRCHSTSIARAAAQPVDGALASSIVDGRYLGPDLADDHPLGRVEPDRRLLRDDASRTLRSTRSRGDARTLRTRFRAQSIECTTCHDPHSRTGPIPNPEEEAMLCGSCHDVARYAFGMHSTAACSDCHALHGARGDALLPDHDENRLCESCHSGLSVSTRSTDSRTLRLNRQRLLSGPRGHVMAPGGRCGDCHPAHGDSGF
jgi:predicted CXXCH cytochrome family protein